MALAEHRAAILHVEASSNYNSRPRVAEVMVDEGQVHLVRKREDVAQLFAGKSALP